jgi:hypothetical protein
MVCKVLLLPPSSDPIKEHILFFKFYLKGGLPVIQKTILIFLFIGT